MFDVAAYARDTEQAVTLPGFSRMLATRRRARHRHAALVATVTVGVVLLVAVGAAGSSRLAERSAISRPSTQPAAVLVPDWGPGDIVGHADAFVVRQVESRTDPHTALTVWKRCAVPRPDHDCLGREAMSVVDGPGHRFLVLGAVTGSLQQPSFGDDGLLREVDEGVWYWAHLQPGPYLVSATMHQPVTLTFLDRPEARSFGVPSIECPDRVGLCTLDTGVGTLQRLALPDVPRTRWATPTASGCGLWGLAGAGGDQRLVIQQRDGSFRKADIPDDLAAATMAEGGQDCEVAYYQTTVAGQTRLCVSIDEGRTWHVRSSPPPQTLGLLEEQPRPRALIPLRWSSLPPARGALAAPGPLHQL